MPKVSEGLFTELKLVVDDWTKNVKQAQADSKELEKSLKPVKTAALEMGTALSAAGGAVVGALVLMTKQAADYGDAIRDMAIRTNTTTKEMSAFKYLAEQSGTSVDVLQKGLTILAKNAYANSTAFKDLGVTTKDSNGNLKSSKELFGEVSDKLSVMKDGTAKTGIELLLFGKSATQMQELLNGGAQGIDDATAATERFGTAIGTDAAAAADKFNDTLNDLGQAQLGLSQAVSAALLPMLTEIAVVVTNAIIKVQEFTNAHPELIKNILLLAGAIAGAGGLLLGVAGVITIMPALTAAFIALTGPVGLTVAAITALVAAFAYFPQLRDVAVDALKWIVEGLGQFASLLGSVGQSLMQLAHGQFQQAFDTIKNGGSKAFEDGKVAASKLDSGLKSLGDALSSLKEDFAHLPDPIEQVNEGLEKTAKKAKTVFDAADALTIKFGEMRGMTIRVAEGIAKQEKTLAELDVAIAKSASASHQIALANREWADTIATLDAGLKKLPIDAADAQNKLLMIKPPVIDIGPTPAQVEAAKQKYQDTFNSVQDTAKRVFVEIGVNGKNAFQVLADTAKGIFETLWTEILSSLTAQLLTPLVGRITGALSGALGRIPGLGSVIGGGASSAAGSVAGSAGSIGSTGASTGLSLASGGLIAAGAAVGGLLGGILGNDRGAQRETAYNTGATYLVLKDTLEQVLWPQFGLINAIAQSPLWSTFADELGYWATQIANVTAQWGGNIVDAIKNIQISVVAGPGAAPAAGSSGGSPSGSAAASPAGNPYGPQGLATFGLFSGTLPDDISNYGAAGLNTFSVFSPGALPQYALGTDYVQQTGPAIVHKGEAIIPAGSSKGVTINVSIGTFVGDSSSIKALVAQLRAEIATQLNDFVQFGGGRLLASGVR